MYPYGAELFKPCFLGSKEPPEDGENMVMPQSKSVTRFGLRQDWSLGDGGDNDDKSAVKDVDCESYGQLRMEFPGFFYHSDFT